MPSGLKATSLTALVCPLRERTCWPVFASHTLTVPSPLAEARCFPSGLKATLQTLSACPLRERTSCPLPLSHAFIAGAGQALAVGAEGYAVHLVSMHLEGEDLPPAARVKDIHRLVPRARRGQAL